MAVRSNHITGLLEAARPDLFGTGLKEVAFDRGDVLARQGDAIEFLYLPKIGMVSYAVDLADGGRIETASIGRNGAVGAAGVLGSKLHANEVVVSLRTTGWAIAVDRIAEIAKELPDFRILLFQAERYATAQAQQIAACNARHTISQRFARWILRAFDESGESELHITQEEIARLLGVQRASLSVVANGLQESGLLRYRRGRIFMLDRAGLERHACACHAAIRAQYDDLFGATQQRALLAQSQACDYYKAIRAGKLDRRLEHPLNE